MTNGTDGNLSGSSVVSRKRSRTDDMLNTDEFIPLSKRINSLSIDKEEESRIENGIRKRARTESSMYDDECVPLSKRINCLMINQPNPNEKVEDGPKLLQQHPYNPQIMTPYFEENKRLYYLYLERLERMNQHPPY